MTDYNLINIEKIMDIIIFILLPSYYFIFIILASRYKINERISRYIGLSPLFLISIMLGLRDNTGSDDGSYKIYFDKVKNGSINYDNNNFEVGYYLLNKFVGILGFNHNFIFFFSSLFVYFGFVFYIKKLKFNNYPLVAFIYITFCIIGNNNSAVRSAIAIGIIYFAVGIFVNKKNIGVIFILGIFAAQFHTIAYIFCIAIIFYKIILTKSKIIYLLFFVTTLFYINLFFYNIIDLYDYFLITYKNYLSLKSLKLNYLFWILIYIYFLIFFINIIKKYSNMKFINLVISILLMQILMMVIFRDMYILWMRFSLIVVPIVLSCYVSINREFNKKLHPLFIIFIFIYYYRTMSVNGYDILNYNYLFY